MFLVDELGDNGNSRALYYKNYDRERNQKLAAFVREQKCGKACGHCGMTNVICLEYHHRDKKTKKFSIAESIHGHVDKKIILAEIKKCDLLCANCHRITEEEIRIKTNGVGTHGKPK